MHTLHTNKITKMRFPRSVCSLARRGVGQPFKLRLGLSPAYSNWMLESVAGTTEQELRQRELGG